jgi:hypothetical protein
MIMPRYPCRHSQLAELADEHRLELRRVVPPLAI